jgi:hypothetical protein
MALELTICAITETLRPSPQVKLGLYIFAVGNNNQFFQVVMQRVIIPPLTTMAVNQGGRRPRSIISACGSALMSASTLITHRNLLVAPSVSEVQAETSSWCRRALRLPLPVTSRGERHRPKGKGGPPAYPSRVCTRKWPGGCGGSGRSPSSLRWAPSWRDGRSGERRSQPPKPFLLHPEGSAELR